MATEAQQAVDDFIVSKLTQYVNELTAQYNATDSMIATADAKITAAQTEKADARTAKRALADKIAAAQAVLNGYQ